VSKELEKEREYREGIEAALAAEVGAVAIFLRPRARACACACAYPTRV
jgi:hypothetical protein